MNNIFSHLDGVNFYNRILLIIEFYKKRFKTLTFLEITEKQYENKLENSILTYSQSLYCLSSLRPFLLRSCSRVQSTPFLELLSPKAPLSFLS